MCCISDSTESAFVCSKMVKQWNNEMERIGLLCSLHEPPEPTPLCKYHYCIIHSILQPPQTNCSTCNISLRHCNSRPCSQPEVTQHHLRENTGFEGHVKARDKVCYTCYKGHLLIFSILLVLIVTTPDPVYMLQENLMEA